MAEPAEQHELVLVADDDGLLVSGPPADVETLVAAMTQAAGPGVAASGIAPVADLAAAAGSIAAFAVTACEYVRHTESSRAAIREHGLIPGEGKGVFRSFVRTEGGQFAKNLDWTKVDVGPERALSLQVAAVALALRIAIKEVQAAVERVEGKVDQI